MSTTIKIGETNLVVDEHGQLCELVNLPYHVFRKYKGEVLRVEEDRIVAHVVSGLAGKYGNIHFVSLQEKK